PRRPGPGSSCAPCRRRWPSSTAGGSRTDLQDRAPDLEPVTGVQRYGRAELLGVDEGPVGRAQVLDPGLAVATEHPGVELGGEGVVQRDPTAGRTTHRHLVTEVEDPSPPLGGLQHSEPHHLSVAPSSVRRHYRTSNRRLVLPTVISSPSFSRLVRTWAPLTRVPLVDPRSTTTTSGPSRRSSAWRRLTFASSTTMAHSGRRPITSGPSSI